MDESLVEMLKGILSSGKDVKGVISLTMSLLNMVKEGIMNADEVLKALDDIKNSILQNEEHQGKNSEVQSGGAQGTTCIVRRMCPTENARVQGFPDDYTKIDGPDTLDSKQYMAYGNSWATPCAFFMSSRMEMALRKLGLKGSVRYATICSGIEAQSVAVKSLNWTGKFFCEIAPFPCRVLAYHYPEIPNLGDITQVRYDADRGVITNAPEEGYELSKEFLKAPLIEIPYKLGALDVLSGGPPCTDVSIAGKRMGMAEHSGTRSALVWHYLRIIDELRPTLFLYENVPGVFSTSGKDFFYFLHRCSELGYALAWRTLDARYIMTEEFPRAVPQRRRRVWLVGYKGNDWRIPATICFERKTDLSSNPPERVNGIGYKNLADGVLPIGEREKTPLESVPSSLGFNLVPEDLQKLLKVSRMMSLEDVSKESDFAKTSMSEILAFAKSVGTPLLLDSVIRTDKRTSCKMVMDDLFSMEGSAQEDTPPIPSLPEESEWEGADKISPKILQNRGNAGILANGRICSMSCPEWTGGIQLSPTSYDAWLELVKSKDYLAANGLLPKAYDGTICGLSDIVLLDVDDKYNISWRSAYGILHRAEKKAKPLCEELDKSIRQVLLDSAGIVKWYALHGKESKPDDNAMSVREAAQDCFAKYIAPTLPFEETEEIIPSNLQRSQTEEDASEEVSDPTLKGWACEGNRASPS